MSSCLDTLGTWLAVEWTDQQRAAFAQYAEWLRTEAAILGGIGPHEIDRVWERHVCDSLAFGRGMHRVSTALDIGSGVGLPGIPLAIAFPDVEIGLVERSGRRVDALHRIVAILELRCDILAMPVEQLDRMADRLMFRGSLRLEEAIPLATRLLHPGGEAWFGLGRGAAPRALHRWRTSPPSLPSNVVFEEVHVSPEILDGGAWLLRMCRS